MILSHFARNSWPAVSLNPLEVLTTLIPPSTKLETLFRDDIVQKDSLPNVVTNREIVDFFAACLKRTLQAISTKRPDELSLQEQRMIGHISKLSKSDGFDLRAYISMVYSHFQEPVPPEYRKPKVVIDDTSPNKQKQTLNTIRMANQRPQDSLRVDQQYRKPKSNRRSPKSRNMTQNGYSLKSTIVPTIANKASRKK